MNTPLVSVIVPSYNHEAYITTCLTRILEQTYPAIELIVVDDGSTDDSVNRITALQQLHGFQFRRQQNRGLSATLNTAIHEMANGKYISICASDDYYTKDRIEKQVAFMEAHPDHAFCFGDVYCVDQNDTITGIMKASRVQGRLYEQFICSRLSIPALSCFYKKSSMEMAGLYDERLFVEDSYMLMKLLKNEPAACLNFVTGYYRRHASNVSATRLHEMYRENLRMIDELYKEEPLYRTVYIRSRVNWFYQFAGVDKKEALQLLQAIPIRYWFSKYMAGGLLKLLLPVKKK